MIVHLLVISSCTQPQEPFVLVATNLAQLAQKFQDYAEEHRNEEHLMTDDQFTKEIEDIQSDILEGVTNYYPELAIARVLKHIRVCM